MSAPAASVYSVGHSNHTSKEFATLLRQHDIQAVADVRSTPYSQRNPQFNREGLRTWLHEHRIAYVFMGLELGGRGSDSAVYDESGRVQYQAVAETDAFRKGIRRVCDGSERMRIALLCSEGDPIRCHRGILVSRVLEQEGVPVAHIYPDGHVESHRETERRLVQLVGMVERDLFRTEDEVLADAYAMQETRIAYTRAEAAEQDPP